MDIMVVALNALIALLGGSFERVQDSKAAKTSRLRAQFAVEYLSMLPEGRRSAIERATMWMHQLVPQSEYERRLDDGGASSEWQGRLAAMKSRDGRGQARAARGRRRPRARRLRRGPHGHVATASSTAQHWVRVEERDGNFLVEGFWHELEDSRKIPVNFT